jgi:hypothetical protein
MEKTLIAAAIIVIIAIVIVAAYAVSYYGRASQSSTVSTTVNPAGSQITTSISPSTSFLAGCNPASGLSCYNASVSTYGEISLSLVQHTGSAFYNVHVACLEASSQSARPSNASAWYALTSLGTTKPFNFSGTTIYPGTTENIANLQCYSSSGIPFSTNGGQGFQGIVLLNYTATIGAVNSSNPWITVDAVTFNLTA